MIQQAIILCGGLGTRLMPLTANMPKVMLPVGGRPLLDYQIRVLIKAGVERFILCTGHLSDKIEAHFGDGSDWGSSILYALERTPLGTAGAVANLPYALDEDFFVVYGDIFFRMDLGRLASFHLEKQAAATLVVHESSHAHDSDIVEMNGDRRVVSVARRPLEPGETAITNAAFLVLNRAFIREIPKRRPVDFSRDVFPVAVTHTPCFGYKTDEFILDIGTQERYEHLLRHWKEFSAQ